MTTDPSNEDVVQEMKALRARVAELERRPRLRPWLIAGAVAGVMVAATALGSVACPNGIPYCFAANEPALATEINANFAALKTWVEAKVGATGPIAAPSNDINTRDINTRNVNANSLVATTTVSAGLVAGAAYSPPYAGWGTQGLGAGGATIMNENVSYNALMLVGNTAAGGTNPRRKIKMYDDVDVNVSLTFGGHDGYDVSCTGGRSNYHYGFCCRMNVRTGATKCKNGTNTLWAGWSDAPDPFGAAANDGHYSLSCAGTIDSANWPICCRTAADGTTYCVASVNAGPLTWNTTVPAPW